MKILPVALLVAFVVPAGAIAQADHAPASNETVLPQDPADSEEIVVEGEVPEKQRRICETRTETGSIIPKRVCRTRARSRTKSGSPANRPKSSGATATRAPSSR